jgi:hypothetical protein
MIWLLLACRLALAGNELGNGGDSFAQEFISLGRSLVEQLKAKPDPKISEDALAAVVESTSVVTKDSLDLRGNEVDAINYPEAKRIELSRSRWQGYDQHQKVSLVLHEYLGISRVDDSSYQISGPYLKPLQQSSSLSVTEEEPASRYSNFFVGLGYGYSISSGEIAKLYKQPILIPELRLGYYLSPSFSVRLAASLSKYDFNAIPLGAVESTLTSVAASAAFHFLNRGTRSGPFLFAGVEHVFRSQTFRAYGDVQRDSAPGVHGGLGMSYEIMPSYTLAMEFKATKIFFADRYESTYLESGVANTTGMRNSFAASMQYYF